MKAIYALVVSATLAAAATTGGAQAATQAGTPAGDLPGTREKLNLNDPKVPIAPDTAKQPPSAVLDSTGIPGATDSAPEDSPMLGKSNATGTPVGRGLPVGSGVSMRLAVMVDSGSVKNGDSIHGTLTTPVKTTGGVMLPAGTRVEGTVVSAAKAGTVQSAGVLSLQLTRVGSVPVVTDVLDFTGQEGHKDVPDAAPKKGSEAIAQVGAMLQFHVLENGPVPGIIPGATLDGKSGKGAGGGTAPGPLPTGGQQNGSPGIHQTPIHGGSSPTTPAGTGK